MEPPNFPFSESGRVFTTILNNIDSRRSENHVVYGDFPISFGGTEQPLPCPTTGVIGSNAAIETAAFRSVSPAPEGGSGGAGRRRPFFLPARSACRQTTTAAAICRTCSSIPSTPIKRAGWRSIRRGLAAPMKGAQTSSRFSRWRQPTSALRYCCGSGNVGR